MNYQEIKTKIIEVVGVDNYTDEKDILINYSSSVNGTVIKPEGIVYPTTTNEVVAIVKLANQSNSKLYPISRGKNWGYGCAQGTQENQIILELSKMNKILNIDQELCYMSLQPGVTQQQAYEYLEALPNANLQLDVTGAGSEASIVGNILEKGFGHTNYGLKYIRVINMTIVLPNEEIIHTGFKAYKDANAKNTYRYGIGPCIDGLFFQSNLGVVVEMTIELMPKPEKFCTVIGTAKNEDAITNLILALRKLSLNGVINSMVHIGNKARIIGNQKNDVVGAWSFSASISGHKKITKAKKYIVRKKLKKEVKGIKLWFITDFIIKWLEIFNKHVKPLSTFQTIKYLSDLQKGIPTNMPLKTLVNNDDIKLSDIKPHDFPVHFRWISAVCKAESTSINQLFDTLRTNFEQFNYEFRVTFTLINGRNLIAIANISYPKNTASVKKATKFYKHCVKELIKKGFYPYRSGSNMYEPLTGAEYSYSELLKKIKQTIDPNDIIAPLKYTIG